MQMKSLLFLIVITVSLSAYSQKVEDVIAAEKAFAKTALDVSIKQAFLDYMDNAAVVFNQGMALNGPEFWRKAPERKFKLIWRPTYAAIAQSGDLGFTTGPFELRASLADTVRAAGQYSTIWKKQKDGSWKFLADLGIGYAGTQFSSQAETNFAADLTASKQKINILKLENGFIREFDQSGVDAFKDKLLPGSWHNIEGHAPIVGSSIQSINFIPADLKFTVMDGMISKSNDLGYVYGQIEYKGSKTNYMRVWGHTQQGWKILLQVLQY